MAEYDCSVVFTADIAFSFGNFDGEELKSKHFDLVNKCVDEICRKYWKPQECPKCLQIYVENWLFDKNTPNVSITKDGVLVFYGVELSAILTVSDRLLDEAFESEIKKVSGLNNIRNVEFGNLD